MPDPIRPGAPAAEPAVARERERVADLEQLASRFKAQGKLAEVIRDGWSVQRFQRWIIDDHLESGRPLGTARTDVGMGHCDLEDYSLRRAILARLSNDWRDAGLEREASDEIARRLDREPRGFFVPLDVLHRPLRRDLGKVAPTTAGATLVGTQHLAASFIDVLRARSVLFRLGAQPLTGLVGDVEIPRQSAAGGAAWIAAEGGDAGSVEGDFDAVTLTPHTIANRQTMTRRLLKQSSPEVEEIIRRDLAFELALAIDRAGISGTGAAGEPVGILSTSGIAAVVFGNPDGGAPTWALILQAESLVAADNADMGNLWYLTTPEARGKMKAVEKVNTTGEFLWNDRVTDDGRRVGEVNGYPAMASTQVPASLTKGAGTGLSAIIFGNFGDVLIGEWGILDLLPDPYEKARSGGLVLHAFQDVDVAIRHPESFAAGTDLNPA